MQISARPDAKIMEQSTSTSRKFTQPTMETKRNRIDIFIGLQYFNLDAQLLSTYSKAEVNEVSAEDMSEENKHLK